MVQNVDGCWHSCGVLVGVVARLGKITHDSTRSSSYITTRVQYTHFRPPSQDAVSSDLLHQSCDPQTSPWPCR